MDEFTEIELAEGDCRLVVRGGRAAAAGDRFLLLPKIRPPPSFRVDISLYPSGALYSAIYRVCNAVAALLE